jgi:hypothetical protein
MNPLFYCSKIFRRLWVGSLLLLGIAMISEPVRAYPPAPFHLFYGMLRDEYGTPLNFVGAEVFLETSTGVKISTKVIPGIENSANYWLEVPMDAALSGPAYQPTALRPTAPFRIKVRVGGTTYLPMEMVGDFASLGQPGKRTRLNLTLGEDSDGDGLPDAWERLFNPDISKVLPGGSAGNGMTYLNSYYAGVYAVDPTNGFTLNIVRMNQGAPVLEFLAVSGRNYTVEGSLDLKTWETQSFRIPDEGTNAAVHASFLATTVLPMQIEVAHQGTNSPPTYFRLMLK